MTDPDDFEMPSDDEDGQPGEMTAGDWAWLAALTAFSLFLFGALFFHVGYVYGRFDYRKFVCFPSEKGWHHCICPDKADCPL